MPTTFKWNENSEEAFTTALSLPPILSLIKDAELKLSKCNTTEALNNTTLQLTNIFRETAKRSLKMRKSTPKTKREAWNTPQLNRLRREVEKKGQDMVKYRTGEYRKRFFLALKIYRKERKYTKRHHLNNQMTKLNELHIANPKKFWQLLQEIKGNKDQDRLTDNIQPGQWYDYLMELNSNPWKNREDDIQNKITIA